MPRRTNIPKTPIVLMVLGAILVFAFSLHSYGPLDLKAAGWVLLLVGLVSFLYVMYRDRDRTVTSADSTAVHADPAGTGDQVVEHRRTTEGL